MAQLSPEECGVSRCSYVCIMSSRRRKAPLPRLRVYLSHAHVCIHSPPHGHAADILRRRASLPKELDRTRFSLFSGAGRPPHPYPMSSLSRARWSPPLHGVCLSLLRSSLACTADGGGRRNRACGERLCADIDPEALRPGLHHQLGARVRGAFPAGGGGG